MYTRSHSRAEFMTRNRETCCEHRPSSNCCDRKKLVIQTPRILAGQHHSQGGEISRMMHHSQMSRWGTLATLLLLSCSMSPSVA
ncbi:hypothetical protein VTO42DRAFT_5126 [Malbranchea cinnamomea]